ncbi:unnamed protein product, partial [Brassica rapa]
ESNDFFIDFISHVFGVYSQTDDDNLKNPAWSDYAITAIYGPSRGVSSHVNIVGRKGCCLIESNPSPHGGRGALPSEGGSPSDLLFLAGGGSQNHLFPSSFSF